MFCNNCGKQISDDSKFCTNCGATNNQVKPTAAFNPMYQTSPTTQGTTLGSKIVYFWLSMAGIVVSIISILSAWLSVPLVRNAYSVFGNSGGKSTYTIFETVKFIDQIDSYVGNSDTGMWKFFAVVFIIIAIAIIVDLVWFAYKLIKDYKNSGKRGRRAFGGAIILSIIFIIIVIAINVYVKDQSKGLLNGVIDVAGGVYCTLITGIIGMILAFKIQKENH